MVPDRSVYLVFQPAEEIGEGGEECARFLKEQTAVREIYACHNRSGYPEGSVVCRDGLGPLSNMADVGHRMYVATRTGLYLTAIGAVLGVLLCFIRMIAAGGVSVLFLFLYMLLITVPLLIIGTTLNLE